MTASANEHQNVTVTVTCPEVNSTFTKSSCGPETIFHTLLSLSLGQELSTPRLPLRPQIRSDESTVGTHPQHSVYNALNHSPRYHPRRLGPSVACLRGRISCLTVRVLAIAVRLDHWIAEGALDGSGGTKICRILS